jgi:glycosyltransferase involved in cell wall biosynthesis
MGPDEAKIKNLALKYKLGNKIIFVGPAFGTKKEKLLAQALFVAFPSRHEGFSLFSLEALASGLPMVSFNIPSLAWVGEEAVLKAKPFNTHQYAQLFLKMTDKKLISQMSKNARNIARNYTWSSVVNKFESFFYKILEREKNEN